MIRNDVNAAPIFSQHLPMQVMERQPDRMMLAAAFDDIHLNPDFSPGHGLRGAVASTGKERCAARCGTSGKQRDAPCRRHSTARRVAPSRAPAL
ncbi:MAG: hypothetical protein QF754_19670, partial [Alphaproteobacteria bacterium]|nr:hypothetical protein [Alphaproteobacteria bacterium]